MALKAIREPDIFPSSRNCLVFRMSVLLKNIEKPENSKIKDSRAVRKNLERCSPVSFTCGLRPVKSWNTAIINTEKLVNANIKLLEVIRKINAMVANNNMIINLMKLSLPNLFMEI